MQLLYVWIEGFRNIKELGFNFSREYEIKYEYLKKDKNKGKEEFFDCMIDISERSNCVQNFFGDNITNVTAIIGKNGTGKSNIIDLICTTLVPGQRPNNLSYFYIIEDKGTFYIINKLKGHEDYKCDYDLVATDDAYHKGRCVYFSNVADSRRLLFKESKRVIDLSFEKNEKSESNKIGFLGHLMNRIENKNDRGIKLNSIEKDLNDKEISFVLKIKSDIKEDIKYDDEWLERYELVKARYKKAFTTTTNNSNLLKYGLTFALFKHLFCDYYGEFIKNEKLSDALIKATSVINEEGQFVAVLEKAKDIKETNPLIYDALVSNLKDPKIFGKPTNFYSHYIEFIENVKDDLKVESEDDLKQNEDELRFVYSKKLRSLLVKYAGIFNLIDIISHDWTNLSSGFKAYLNMFSNIYISLENDDCSNILICIDEGDLYFHPEMQRNFLKDILDFFKLEFPKKQIQIILTSHSPFIVSDLPKECLLLFNQKVEKRKDDSITTDAIINNNLVIESSNSLTFASNIYKLFDNSFFLDNGTIGEFALSKIKDIVNLIEYDNTKNISIKDAWKIIACIGEPIIKEKMEKSLLNYILKKDNSEEIEKRKQHLEYQLQMINSLEK